MKKKVRCKDPSGSINRKQQTTGLSDRDEVCDEVTDDDIGEEDNISTDYTFGSINGIAIVGDLLEPHRPSLSARKWSWASGCKGNLPFEDQIPFSQKPGECHPINNCGDLESLRLIGGMIDKTLDKTYKIWKPLFEYDDDSEGML